MTFARMPNLTLNPTAKDEIQALATPALKAAYDKETYKMLFLDGVICDAGWDLSITDRPQQWARVIGWLENKLETGETK